MMNLENLANWLSRHSFPCMTKLLFGIDCPFCGFQRSVIALLKGDLSVCVTLFPALIPLLLTGLTALIYLKLHTSKFRQLLIGMVMADGIIIILNWIIKIINTVLF